MIRSLLASVAIAVLLLAAGCEAPDNAATSETQDRLVGTWLREYEEDGTQVRQVRFLTEGHQETRQVIGTGDLVFGFDAEHQAQRGVALEVLQASIDREVTQGDGQQEGAPEDLDGIVVASLAPRRAEGLEQVVIGDGFEETAERLQGRGIFQGVPGEQGLGDGDFHGGSRGSGVGGQPTHSYNATDPRRGCRLGEDS